MTKFMKPSKAASSTIFWVFGMTRSRIEPRSPGSLVNSLLIWPMVFKNVKWLNIFRDETPTGITNQSIDGSDSYKEYLTFTKAPGVEPHYKMVQFHIQNTRFGGDLCRLQKCSWCILQPQPKLHSKMSLVFFSWTICTMILVINISTNAHF